MTESKTIKFDVMMHDRWVCTMTMPVTPWEIEAYDGETPVIREQAIRDFVETQRPSLKGKPYSCEPTTGKPIFANHD